MLIGETLRQAARTAAREHAVGQSWRVLRVTVGADVLILATGECAVAVCVALEGGGQHGFEYRCDVTGAGKLLALDGQEPPAAAAFSPPGASRA